MKELKISIWKGRNVPQSLSTFADVERPFYYLLITLFVSLEHTTLLRLTHFSHNILQFHKSLPLIFCKKNPKISENFVKNFCKKPKILENPIFAKYWIGRICILEETNLHTHKVWNWRYYIHVSLENGTVKTFVVIAGDNVSSSKRCGYVQERILSMASAQWVHVR